MLLASIYLSINLLISSGSFIILEIPFLGGKLIQMLLFISSTIYSIFKLLISLLVRPHFIISENIKKAILSLLFLVNSNKLFNSSVEGSISSFRVLSISGKEISLK